MYRRFDYPWMGIAILIGVFCTWFAAEYINKLPFPKVETAPPQMALLVADTYSAGQVMYVFTNPRVQEDQYTGKAVRLYSPDELEAYDFVVQYEFDGDARQPSQRTYSAAQIYALLVKDGELAELYREPKNLVFSIGMVEKRKIQSVTLLRSTVHDRTSHRPTHRRRACRLD